jgi:hypothetical protein
MQTAQCLGKNLELYTRKICNILYVPTNTHAYVEKGGIVHATQSVAMPPQYSAFNRLQHPHRPLGKVSPVMN